MHSDEFSYRELRAFPVEPATIKDEEAALVTVNGLHGEQTKEGNLKDGAWLQDDSGWRW